MRTLLRSEGLQGRAASARASVERRIAYISAHVAEGGLLLLTGAYFLLLYAVRVTFFKSEE